MVRFIILVSLLNLNVFGQEIEVTQCLGLGGVVESSSKNVKCSIEVWRFYQFLSIKNLDKGPPPSGHLCNLNIAEYNCLRAGGENRQTRSSEGTASVCVISQGKLEKLFR